MIVGPRTTAPLSSRRAFAALRASGHRGASGPISVRFLPSTDGVPQLAYAVPRRVGGAVTRNRIRRRLRGAVETVGEELQSGAYLVSAEAACRTVPFGELVGALRSSLGAAGALREAQ